MVSATKTLTFSPAYLSQPVNLMNMSCPVLCQAYLSYSSF